jgi:hypothetical protein
MVILAHKENKLLEALDFTLFREKMFRSMQLQYSNSTIEYLNFLHDPKAFGEFCFFLQMN